jgi:hypothetical protein
MLKKIANMLKNLFLFFIILGIIGSFLPDKAGGNDTEKQEVESSQGSYNEPEESNNNTDLIEDPLDMKDKKSEEAPRNTTVYSKDDLANEIILRYNEQNPDNTVEPEMVENWLTGGYDQATEIHMGDYHISFGYADATPTYSIYSYKEKSEENREEFIETAITWIRAIHGFSEDTLNSIADSFLKNENPDIFSVKVGYNKYKYIAYENRPSVWDRYKDATYWIFCYEDY